jgi:3',5'-cyclic AMP phosphodiesterase CpdA
MPKVLARFAHIGDTHLTPNDEERFNPDHYSERLLTVIKEEIAKYPEMRRPAVPASTAVRAMIRHVNELPMDLDFVLHTGDIMTDPTGPQEYAWAKEVMGELRAPVHMLLGNHDLAEGVSRYFGSQGNGTRDFEVDANGVQLLCVDSATHGVDHGGGVTDRQLQWLEERCTSDDDRPLVVAIHHPPMTYGIPLMDMVGFSGGEVLHEVFRRAGSRLQGVFSGHIHQGLDVVRDGIFYSTVQHPQSPTNLWPFADERTRTHSSSPNPGFTVVTVTDEGSYMRRFTYPLPEEAEAKA